MSLDLEELKRLADKATPGPWVAHHLEIESANGKMKIYDEGGHTRADAAYIAAASPSVVDELIQRLERAEQDSKRLMYLVDMVGVDGFLNVKKDRYEFATECAAEAGRIEPNAEDELNGFRRLVDAAML